MAFVWFSRPEGARVRGLELGLPKTFHARSYSPKVPFIGFSKVDTGSVDL